MYTVPGLFKAWRSGLMCVRDAFFSHIHDYGLRLVWFDNVSWDVGLTWEILAESVRLKGLGTVST
jgi:hypothetical protein